MIGVDCYMYGVSKISVAENILLVTFPGAKYSSQSLAEYLNIFAEGGVVVDMICQSIPHGESVDFSFSTNYSNFATVMKLLPEVTVHGIPSPLISGGYAKINLFGEEMVTSCGVAARALSALAEYNIEISMITTSDLDISLLLHESDIDIAVQALNTVFSL